MFLRPSFHSPLFRKNSLNWKNALGEKESLVRLKPLTAKSLLELLRMLSLGEAEYIPPFSIF